MQSAPTAGAARFGPLPEVGELLTDEPGWQYPSTCAAGSGQARLRVWASCGAPGRIAVVTELGIGASTTNSAEMIWAELASTLPGPLTLIEHWPADRHSDEHLDQVAVASGHPAWRRIWPVPDTNPSHAEFLRWMTAGGGHQILDGAFHAQDMGLT